MRATIVYMKLIEILKNLQQLEHLSDREFAKKLGVHRTTWIRIKTGKTKDLSAKFLGCVLKAYPGLKRDVDIFLTNSATNCSNDFKNVAKGV